MTKSQKLVIVALSICSMPLAQAAVGTANSADRAACKSMGISTTGKRTSADGTAIGTRIVVVEQSTGLFDVLQYTPAQNNGPKEKREGKSKEEVEDFIESETGESGEPWTDPFRPPKEPVRPVEER